MKTRTSRYCRGALKYGTRSSSTCFSISLKSPALRANSASIKRPLRRRILRSTATEPRWLRQLWRRWQSAVDNPLWYNLSLDVGLDQSKDKVDLREIFDEG